MANNNFGENYGSLSEGDTEKSHIDLERRNRNMGADVIRNDRGAMPDNQKRLRRQATPTKDENQQQKKGGRSTSNTDGKKDKQKERITTTTAMLMVGLAIFFDILSIIPVVNWFTAIAAWLCFFIWFAVLEVRFMTIKRALPAIISFIVELVPILSIIPGLTLGIIVIIIMIKLEDKTGIKIPLSTIEK